MLKGAWAAGCLGKPMLTAYKRALSEDVALFELFDTLLVLLVLGQRSTKLRAEIRDHQIITAVSGVSAGGRSPLSQRASERERSAELSRRRLPYRAGITDDLCSHGIPVTKSPRATRARLSLTR